VAFAAVAFALPFAAFGFARAFVPRSPPKRVARVAGRLPRTPGSSVFSVIDQPVYVSRPPLGASRIQRLVKPAACHGVEGSRRTLLMDARRWTA
jgi:hypothetical protein